MAGENQFPETPTMSACGVNGPFSKRWVLEQPIFRYLSIPNNAEFSYS